MIRRLSLLLVALWLMVASPAVVSAGPPSVEGAVPRIVLPNGLVVLLSEDHKAPVVGMELRYRVGWRDDPQGRPGLAALTQRMMMRATRHVGEGDYERYLDGVGTSGSGYASNADRTTFQVTVPADHLALPLWLWSDQMGFFAERLDDALLAEGIKAALREHAQRVDAVPAANVRSIADAVLFPPDHPYHSGAGGTMSAIGNVTLREARAFAQSHFCPAQAVLSIVGDFETVHALALVNRYFATIPPCSSPPRPQAPLARMDREKRLVMAAHAELPMLAIAWPTVGQHAPDDAALDVIGEVLAGNHGGVLRWRLVDQLKVAARVSARQASRDLGSVFWIEATALRGHTPQEMLDAIDEVLEQIQRGPVDPRLTGGGKAGYLLEHLFAVEQSGFRAARIAECEEFNLGTPCITRWTESYTSLSAADLSSVAGRELPRGRRLVIEIDPSSDAPVAGELRDNPAGGP